MATKTWHKDNNSWKKINTFLFNNATMADCSFLVTVENTVVQIPAHKYVLGGYSPEFYNLFYLLKSDTDEIPINDVCGESFLKFLEFVYTETTELSLDNIEVLMKLAVRYSVDSFKDFCEDFLMKSITVENVFSLMDKFSIYGLPSFESKCIKTIKSYRLIFDDPSFYEISNETLTTIVKSEELTGFKEITIFKGVDKWAEVFCDKNDKEINSNNKRLALGGALKYIRFGSMTIDEFSSCSLNLEKSILTPTEMVKVFQFIGTNGRVNCPYSGIKRSNKIEILYLRHDAILIPGLRQMKGYDIFHIIPTTPIKFHGFGIFGRIDSLDIQNPENFIIQLKDSQTGAVLLSNVVEIHHDGTENVYELLFKRPKRLEANKSYTIYIKRQESGSFLNFIYRMYKNQTIDILSINLIDAKYTNIASIVYKKG